MLSNLQDLLPLHACKLKLENLHSPSRFLPPRQLATHPLSAFKLALPCSSVTCAVMHAVAKHCSAQGCTLYSLRGSNPRPMAHKTIALTTELREHFNSITTWLLLHGTHSHEHLVVCIRTLLPAAGACCLCSITLLSSFTPCSNVYDGSSPHLAAHIVVHSYLRSAWPSEACVM